MQYDTVATGGTFDIIHAGHVALLARAFEISSFVIIGLVSDGFAASRGKKPENPYGKRRDGLARLIDERFGPGRYEISRLDAEFGPAVTEGRVGALVASQETAGAGARLNEIRTGRGLPPVDIVTVPMVKSEDGRAISTTRIRNSEIDPDGRIRPN